MFKISGAVKAETVMTLDGKQAKTVNGADVTIKVVDGSVKIDGANVVSTDIICDNGVIHVIDSVLLPALAQPKEKRDEDMTKAEIEAKYNTGRKLYKVCTKSYHSLPCHEHMYVRGSLYADLSLTNHLIMNKCFHYTICNSSHHYLLRIQ